MFLAILERDATGMWRLLLILLDEAAFLSLY